MWCYEENDNNSIPGRLSTKAKKLLSSDKDSVEILPGYPIKQEENSYMWLNTYLFYYNIP